MKRAAIYRWLRWVLVILLIFAFSAYTTLTLIGVAMDNGYVKPPRIPDTTPPTVSLNGGSTITVAINAKYEDAGIEAYDDRSEIDIETIGEVDVNTEGEYTILYAVTDRSGNKTEVSRVVKVVHPKGIIYLTFDDGPGPYTAQLLDVLKKYDVKATFFVTGAGDDDLILREYNEGHSIGLHTYSHDYSYIYQSTENFFDDLYRVQNRVKNITGYESHLMRFPGGSSNTVSYKYDGKTRIMTRLVEEVTEKGFTYFDWNITSGDAGQATSSDQIYENVTNALGEGGSYVVLQHDIKGFSVDAVESIIQFGLSQGYVFSGLTADSFTAHHRVNN